jgi:YHS domain-containing protein
MKIAYLTVLEAFVSGRTIFTVRKSEIYVFTYIKFEFMKTYGLTLFLLTIALTAIGQTQELRAMHFNVRKKLAIEGYDPVSYFTNKPLEGSEKFSHSHKGITYYFSSAANLQKFKTAPEKYEPAYGGWCAYAMGENGEKVKIDPETFKIVDGKLLLFYNFWGNNTLEDWNTAERKLKQSADNNWLKIVK